jgi:Ca-activated chloride channel family protein
LYQHLITTDGLKKSRPPLYLLGFCWVIASLALAGPTWQRLPQPVYQLNTGKVVLMDMSLSMRATDVKPDRLTRAKYKAIDLVNAITEGETGLVAYAGDAFTISPLSSDAQNLTTLIPSLTPEIMPIAGSDPALGLKAAIELLTNAGYQQGEIFWITDGVENQQMKEISEIINASTFRLSVLGVGSEEGAPIQLTNGELLKDSRGSIVIPKLNAANLTSLSRSGGGRYASMQANDSDIDYLIAQSLIEQDPTENEQSEQNFGDKWQEMGPYLLLLILPFAAYSFRRGIVTVMLIGLMLPIYTPKAHADWWQDMWKTPDQQAMQAFKQNEYEQAAKQFEDPLWQGTAHYKNQDYQAALESYSKIAQADPSNLDATYNAGNALAQLGEIDQAIAAYEQVLSQNPDYSDAAANKALLEKLKEQQEQQQQDQQGDQSQEQQDKQEQNEQQQDGEQNSENQEGESSDQQQQNSSSQQNSEEQDPSENSEEQPAEKQQSEQEQAQQQAQQAQADAEEKAQQEQQAQAMQQGEQELTDEQKEQMQRLQNLLNRVPDDPAFLLKRKMQIEAQRRKRERLPTNIQGNW